MTASANTGPLIVAVGGGKGGVGKSMVAANLACAMSQLGFRVVAVDADLGSANLHTILGVDHPGPGIAGFLQKQVSTLEDVVIPSPQRRLFVVPGSTAIPGAANLMHARKLKLMRHIRRLDAEAVVIDCGAGINYNVIDFFNLADLRLLVLTPQLVSLQNAYGALKASLYRTVRQHCSAHGQAALFDELAAPSETDRLLQLIEAIRTRDAELAAALTWVLDGYRVSLIGNQLQSKADQGPLRAMTRMIADFLAVRSPLSTVLPRSDRIHTSVSRRRPFVADSSETPEARALLSLAETLLETDITSLRRRSEPVRASERSSGVHPLPPQEFLEAELPEPLAHYRRAHERHNVDWPVALEHHGRWQRAKLADVSMGGIAVVGASDLGEGDTVNLVFQLNGEELALSTRVVHCSDDRFGAQFVKQADPQAVRRLVEAARQANAGRAA
ncbi:MAG: PilZ domain-containing protein [Myxococcales bacterium]|nr:PilZ domain-containing protein [Myxococcales bacterium]